MGTSMTPRRHVDSDLNDPVFQIPQQIINICLPEEFSDKIKCEGGHHIISSLR